MSEPGTPHSAHGGHEPPAARSFLEVLFSPKGELTGAIIAGVFLLAGFIVHTLLKQERAEWLVWVSLGVGMIYGLRAAARVFFGPASEQLQRVTAQHPPADLDWKEKLPALILLAALLLFGFYPKAISQPVDQALNPAPVTLTAPAR